VTYSAAIFARLANPFAWPALLNEYDKLAANVFAMLCLAAVLA
jgi:hypothetical protein